MKTKTFVPALLLAACTAVVNAQATQPTNAIALGSYLGTSNNNDVVFKRNATSAGAIGLTTASLGVNAVAVKETVSIGANAGRYSSGGGSHPFNVFVGWNSGSGNSITPNTGNENTFVGANTGVMNTIGSANTFLGQASGAGNITGHGNTMTGYRTGASNNGSFNVFIGDYSGYSATNASANVFIGHSSGENETGSNLLYIENSSSASPLIWGDFAADHVKLNGKTGIGMPSEAFPSVVGGTNVSAYKLFVRGGVLADEVRVRTTWSDYVFEDDYKLPTLEEVEKHIKEKGYLINVPSGKTVESDGIEVGQMAKIQQEKIEELTLYVIEQNKINKRQSEEIAELKTMLKELAAKK